MPRCIACRLFKGELSIYHPAEVIFEAFDITFLEFAPVLNFDDQKITRSASGSPDITPWPKGSSSSATG